MQRERRYDDLFSAGDNKSYLCKVPDFNQILSFLADFRKSPQYQFSRKSVHSEPLWCIFGQKDTRKTHGDAHNLFSWLLQSA